MKTINQRLETQKNTERQRRLRLGYYQQGLNSKGEPLTRASRYTGHLPNNEPPQMSETEKAWRELRATIPVEQEEE